MKKYIAILFLILSANLFAQMGYSVRSSSGTGTASQINGISPIVTSGTTTVTISLSTPYVSINTQTVTLGSNITLTTSSSVTINSGAGISVTGSVKNFTVTNTSPDQTVTFTSVGSNTITGTYPDFTLTTPANVTSITGNAGTATTLQTARTITGVSFNGSANITVLAGAGTGISVNSSNTISSNLSTGVSGGGSVIGGTGVNDPLTIIGTIGAGTSTVSAIELQPTTGISYGHFYNNGNILLGTYSVNASNYGGFSVGYGSSWMTFRDLVGTTTEGAIYFNQTAPSSSNYAFRSTNNTSSFNASSQLNMKISGTTYLAMLAQSGQPTFALTGFVQSSGVDKFMTITYPTSTGSTASTENIAMSVGGGTVTHATGAITSNSDFKFLTRTHAASASSIITTSSTLEVPAPTAGSNVTITNPFTIKSVGDFGTQHIVGITSAPTIAAGAGAGTSPTVTIANGTDLSGILNITTGTVPTGTNAVVATITFNVGYKQAPNIVLYPANAVTATLSGVSMVFVTSTTTTFIVTSGTTALTGSTAYQWFYMCMQ